MTLKLSRRQFVSGASAGLLAAPFALPHLARAQGAAKVVVIGGGFGGTSLARHLKRHNPDIAVTLIEKDQTFSTCPFSNGVLGGLWKMSDITFTYDKVKAAGIDVIHDLASAIDPDKKTVSLKGGDTVSYDYLVVSPGIQFVWGAIEGYDEAAAQIMPHAWQAGPQTELLRSQLEAMEDGGTVVIATPQPPFRCPPGPYERASLIANYLHQEKPKSKLLILDAQENFSKQPQFEEAWERLYPGLIERVPASESGQVMNVDTATMTVSTAFDDYTPAVANIIPPQRAGQIAIDAGLDEGKGFCSIDPLTFESTVHRSIYVLGDASLAGAMPKSGFSANNQAKACGEAILAAIAGREATAARLLNVCYSFASADYAFDVADIFSVEGDTIKLDIDEGRVMAVGLSDEIHKQEAGYAHSWYQNITAEMFG